MMRSQIASSLIVQPSALADSKSAELTLVMPSR